MTEDVHTAWTEYRSQHATALGDMSDANASLRTPEQVVIMCTLVLITELSGLQIKLR